MRLGNYTARSDGRSKDYRQRSPPIPKPERTMNDTPTPSPFATDGQRTTDAECWMNYCLEAEKELTAVTEQQDRLAEALEYILGIGLTQKTKAKAEKALEYLTQTQ